MDKRIVTVFVLFNLIVVALAALLWNRSSKPSTQLTTPSPLPSVSQAEAPSAQTKALYQSPRELTAPKETSPACKDYWSALATIDLKTAFYRTPGKPIVIPKPGECRDVPTRLAKVHAHLNEVCAPFQQNPQTVSEEVYLQVAPQCQLALFHYRAYVTHLSTEGVEAKDIHDPKIALDKMFATMQEDPQTSAEMAERLVELQPGLYQAAKAAVMARFFDATQKAASKENDPKWDKMKDAIELAKRNGGENDPQLVEAELMGRFGQDPASLKDAGAKVASEHPNKGVGPYYSAWGSLIAGDKRGAEEALQEALRREPGNARFHQTLQCQKKGEANCFQSDLSFSDPSEYLR